ncbi:putative signal transducing protein [Microbulbifer celer]|uniref:DUF2007 domain-containing protein n=1 Tax=Microbulbifer celer TaxID=435905 RepID=A0ABW3UBY2_9GAMM|nr:DUF2007 domain-containing protein [Microbulbifer celer]UFN55864.1 DUF2007 domain-containing protein [Microbulbifer celer]
MKLVYTHENILLVSNAQALLRQAGIETLLKNEFSGAGRGELGVFDTWPEIWVLSDDQFPKAQALLKSVSDKEEEDDWVCAACGEMNGSAFFACWNCQTERNI